MDLSNGTTNFSFCNIDDGLRDSDKHAIINTYRFASSAVLIFGLLGNILTCYVIITRKTMRRSIHMYTLNLAATDLLILIIYLPTQLTLFENDFRWVLGKGLCTISHLAVSISLNASIGTLIAITIDRHRGAVKPFKWRSDTLRNSMYIIPSIWVLAVALSVPFFWVTKHVEQCGSFFCAEMWESVVLRDAYWSSMFILQCLAPIVVIVTLNLHILYHVRSFTTSPAHQNGGNRMLPLICALVVVYIACTAPQHVSYFCLVFSSDNCGQTPTVGMYTYMVGNLLVIAQSAINPVIYGTFRQDFKLAFRNTLRLTQCNNQIHKRLQRSRDRTAVSTESGSEPMPFSNGNSSPVTLLREAKTKPDAGTQAYKESIFGRKEKEASLLRIEEKIDTRPNGNNNGYIPLEQQRLPSYTSDDVFYEDNSDVFTQKREQNCRSSKRNRSSIKLRFSKLTEDPIRFLQNLISSPETDI